MDQGERIIRNEDCKECDGRGYFKTGNPFSPVKITTNNSALATGNVRQCPACLAAYNEWRAKGGEPAQRPAF